MRDFRELKVLGQGAQSHIGRLQDDADISQG